MSHDAFIVIMCIIGLVTTIIIAGIIWFTSGGLGSL